MQATFYVMAPGQTLFAEADFADFGASLPAALADLQFAPGRLLVLDDDGADLGGWVDTFAVLVPALCLDGAAALARGESFAYSFDAYDETAELSVVDGRARAAGGEFGSFDCDRAALVAALVDCGARFVALMGNLAGEDDFVAELRGRLEAAQAAAAGLT